MITLPMTKFELVIPGKGTFDVTNDLHSWKELEVRLERENASGVSKALSFPIEFVLDAADMLKTEFWEKGLYAKANLLCYRRHNEFNTYTLVHSLKLLFQSYEHTDIMVVMRGKWITPQEYIKSFGKTKYDIHVNDIAETKLWDYQRMILLANSNYTIPNGTFLNKNILYRYLSVYYESSEIPPGGSVHTGQSQDINTHPGHIFEARSNVDVEITLQVGISANLGTLQEGDIVNKQMRLILKSSDMGDEISEHKRIEEFPLDNQVSETNIFYTEINNSGNTIKWALAPGDRISLEAYVYIARNDDVIYKQMEIYTPASVDESIIRIEWKTKGNPVNMQVIKPETLLQKYMDLMTGGGFSGVINWNETSFKPMLCAAETIRGMLSNTLHGSFNDFNEWMRVMGYEREYTATSVIYNRRDTYFRRDLTAIELGERDLADLQVVTDDEYAYNAIEVGYERKDYEASNGRFETNGVFEYTTGYIADFDTNKLSLISPYRADSIGIELLTWSRFQNATDTKSDNDIFVVAMIDRGSYYQEEQTRFEGSVPIALFNYYLNPKELIYRNESLIGIITNRLNLTSTTSFREIPILTDYPTLSINKKLHEPAYYNIAVGNHIELPGTDKHSGLVKFPYKGKNYIGFIKSIQKNYGCDTEQVWEIMIVKED